MNVEIYIKERNGSRQIRIPWLPEEIKYESGGISTAAYDIMNRGEVAVPTGSGLAKISWTSELPGAYRSDDSMMHGPWQDPKNYHNTLLDWRNNGTPLNLLVIGYPINLDVYLEDYNATASGAFGDIIYDVSFVEDRDIKITSTKVETPATPSTTKRPATTPTTYTIKSGDTLWSIAQKLLGSGAKWTTIYNTNKEIIESTAKKRWKAAGINRDSQNGHWIFPGTVITIPGAGGVVSTSKKQYTVRIDDGIGSAQFLSATVSYVSGGKTTQTGKMSTKDLTIKADAGTAVKIAVLPKYNLTYSIMFTPSGGITRGANNTFTIENIQKDYIIIVKWAER